MAKWKKIKGLKGRTFWRRRVRINGRKIAQTAKQGRGREQSR